jgi:hypothetical protein
LVGTFFNLIKSRYEKPTANTNLMKSLMLSLKIWNKASIQLCTEYPREGGRRKGGKEGRRETKACSLERKNKTLLIQR